MPSPFPGMDPYIESWIFGSFHSNLITAIYDRLNPRLPKRFIASTELYVWRVDNAESVASLHCNWTRGRRRNGATGSTAYS